MGTMNIYNTSGANKASLTFTGSSDVTVDANKVSNVLNAPCFSAYSTSAQTVSSNTSTKVILPTEEYDTASCYDNTTNYRFTPNVAGYYQINTALFGKGSTATNAILCTVRKNGSDLPYSFANQGAYVYIPSGTIADGASTKSIMVYLNGTTDYIEMYGLIVGSGTVTFNNAVFQAYFVRGA